MGKPPGGSLPVLYCHYTVHGQASWRQFTGTVLSLHCTWASLLDAVYQYCIVTTLYMSKPPGGSLPVLYCHYTVRGQASWMQFTSTVLSLHCTWATSSRQITSTVLSLHCTWASLLETVYQYCIVNTLYMGKPPGGSLPVLYCHYTVHRQASWRQLTSTVLSLHCT